MIYYNGDIKEVRYNGHDIKEIYSCGGNLVWSGSTTPPTPPTSDKLTYTVSGNTYTIPCNGDSTLTRLEKLNSLISNFGTLNVKLESAVIGNCVTVIDDNTFNEETALTSVTIPNTVTTIKANAFYRCTSLSSVTIPTSVTNIEGSAFETTSLQSLSIPTSITQITDAVFRDNIYLNTIVIPSGVTSIGKEAFYFEHYAQDPKRTISENLARNRSVIINAETPPTLSSGVFSWSGLENECTYPIYVPSASVNDYKSAWSQYASRIQAIP